MVDQPYQFDFYDGGGIEIAFLSFAEVDMHGNVNVSRFGDRIIGPGGFINISQNAKTMVFSGTFTSRGVDIGWTDGRIQIAQEGREKKFVKDVQQITYSGAVAQANGQETFFVTERAVFRRNQAGRIELIEIAPGTDLERDILAHMDFRPDISPSLRTMEERLFHPGLMGLAATIADRRRAPRSPRLAALV